MFRRIYLHIVEDNKELSFGMDAGAMKDGFGEDGEGILGKDNIVIHFHTRLSSRKGRQQLLDDS